MAAVGRQRRLVVLRALGLGDLLTAVPALRALADAFPDHRRLLACPRALAPLAMLSGAVDEVIDSAPLAPLDSSLEGIDVAVNLHGRGPQSHRLLSKLRPRRLLAFANAQAGFAHGPAWRREEHEVERWCRMLEESGAPADPSRLDLDAIDPPGAGIARGATVLHPGGASPARRWPIDRFAAVARSELAAGRPILVTGGPDEQALATELARLAGLPEDSVLAGHTALPALVAIVAGAARVVCGDTGTAHLATAVGTPSVVLFGPVSPSEWGPPPDRPRHRALWAGRRGDPHGLSVDTGLLEIAVEDVLRALDQLPVRRAVAN